MNGTMAATPDKDGHQPEPGTVQEGFQRQEGSDLFPVDRLQLSLHGSVSAPKI